MGVVKGGRAGVIPAGERLSCGLGQAPQAKTLAEGGRFQVYSNRCLRSCGGWEPRFFDTEGRGGDTDGTQMEIGDWRLEIGDWRLEIGDWRWGLGERVTRSLGAPEPSVPR